MSKTVVVKSVFTVFVALLISLSVDAQCNTSPEVYFKYGLDDVNHPRSTGVTSGVIYLERILPKNSSDPVPTRKFISVYAVNSATNDEYSAYVEDNTDDDIYAEFSYDQDDFDLITYSWEVEYASTAGQVKVCDYHSTSFKIGLKYSGLGEKLKAHTRNSVFSNAGSQVVNNAELAKQMRNRIAAQSAML